MVQKIEMKSHLINALLPDFAKHFFWNLIIFLGLYLIYFLLDKVFKLGYNVEIILFGSFLTIFISFLMISKDLIIILSTKFIFYSTHLETHFKLFKEENHSITYSQITDIQVRKDIWDRICNVGDLIFHTGNDTYDSHGKGHSLILRNIKHPDVIKQEILRQISLHKTQRIN